jgi:hypothetical protein
LYEFHHINDAPLFRALEITATAATAPNVANPFTDLTFEGTFTPKDGVPVRVDGFCDSEDGTVFRLRFMPRLAGHYDYRVTLRQGGTTLATEKGAFVAEDRGLNGPVRVDPQYPWHFVYEGTGEHFFYNGTTTYWLLGWDEDNIERILERLQRLGVTRIRLTLCARVTDGRSWDENVFPSENFSFLLNPWVAERPDSVENPGFDVTRFHLPHWRKVERTLEMAHERGIIVSVIFYTDGAKPGVEPFGKENAGKADEQRYYRYAVARLASFSNVMWDVTNEYRLFRDDDWAKKMGRFLKSCDPYHLTTSIHGHGTFTFRTEPWADYAMYQSWDEHGGNAFMLKNRELQKETGRIIPQVNEEYGYEDHYPKGWGEGRVAPSRSADNRRRLAWEIAMAGGYQTTGERAEPDGGWINGNGSADSTEMLIGNARIREFLRSFAWWRTEPANHLARAAVGTALCLAEPGKLYAVWLPQGGTATITLEPGTYSARWFDPHTGAFEEIPAVIMTAAGEWGTPAPPEGSAEQDWALLLTTDD